MQEPDVVAGRPLETVRPADRDGTPRQSGKGLRAPQGCICRDAHVSQSLLRVGKMGRDDGRHAAGGDTCARPVCIGRATPLAARLSTRRAYGPLPELSNVRDAAREPPGAVSEGRYHWVRGASYWKRMLLVQRCRRIAWLVCLLLALWALLFSLLDPGFQHQSTVMLVKSMFTFIVAVAAAVNLLTFQARM